MSLIKTPLFRDSREYREVCWYCGVSLTTPRANKKLRSTDRTRDHVLAIANGGTGGESNLVPCCNRCNQWKGVKTLDEFRKIARPGTGNDALFYGEVRELELIERRLNRPFNSTMAERLQEALNLNLKWKGLLNGTEETKVQNEV